MSHPASNNAACAKAHDLIFARLEPLPGPREKPSDMFFLETHLEECPDCREYQTVISREVHVLNDLEPVAVPSGLSDRIMARISLEIVENAKQKQSFRGKRSNWQKSWPSMAAAVLLVAVSWSVSSSLFGPSANHLKMATGNPASPQHLSDSKRPLVATMPNKETILSAPKPTTTFSSKTTSQESIADNNSNENTDGLELAYAGEDRILDPEWSEPSSKSVLPTAKKAPEPHTTPAAAAAVTKSEPDTIPVADSGESEDDPLSPLVGF